MSRVLFSPEARQDLREIRAYIREDNPDAAQRVVERIKQACERIANMPEIGHIRRDLAAEVLRFWPVYSYLIVYRPDKRPVQIVRILHGARDIPQVLQEGRS